MHGQLRAEGYPERWRIAGYVLKEAEGRSYRWSPFGYLFTIKAVGDEMDRDIAFIEFATERGKEPPSHVHEGEDEVFYVLSGELTFICGENAIDAGPNDFVFLTDGLVHLLVVTITREQDGRRFGKEIEETGERVTRDTVLRYVDELRSR